MDYKTIEHMAEQNFYNQFDYRDEDSDSEWDAAEAEAQAADYTYHFND